MAFPSIILQCLQTSVRVGDRETITFHLNKIIFKASENITETITITLDSAKGSTYDVVLKKVTLIGKQDYVFTPEEGDADLQDGDEIKVECTAANDTGSIYGIVKCTELLR